jgi:hypothetical protein
MRYISGTKLDERVIRCDLDPGYIEGRQFGRGKSGGQVRDEYREEYDGGRGGWGHDVLRRQSQAEKRLQGHFDTYASEAGGLGMAGADVPAGEGYERDNRKRGREEDEDDDERIVSSFNPQPVPKLIINLCRTGSAVAWRKGRGRRGMRGKGLSERISVGLSGPLSTMSYQAPNVQLQCETSCQT